MNKSPCYDCKKRDIYCHDSCPEFQAFRKKIDDHNNKKVNIVDANGYVINTIYRFRRD